MKEITRSEAVAVKSVPAVELSRLDLEVAIRDFLMKRGYVLASLAQFQYENGVVSKVIVDVEKK